MKMVGHQAVAEERERVPCLGAGEIAKEHIPFAVGAENIGSVVPTVDRVVNKVIACRSWKSSHESNLLPRQESFASLHILTRRASEGSEALPSLARRVRMSFFGARVIPT